MINSVKIINDLGESLEMGIWKPDKSGLLISNIEGLSPASATINTTETATTDGSVYNSVKFQERTITIDMYYNPAHFTQESIENLRHLGYQYFPIKKQVRLEFHTDQRDLWIDGRIEANETNIFSEMEEGSISIVCPDPYFRKDGKQRFHLSSSIDMFEFPFSNESLDDPLLVMSELNVTNSGRFFYEGDVDTGCIIRIEFSDYVHDLRLYNFSSNEEMRINTELINSITSPKIKGHLTGIEDDKGEYVFDEYGNILEGYVLDGVETVNGTLLGVEDAWGEFLTDENGITIEGLFADIYTDIVSTELVMIENEAGMYLTDNKGNYIEGYNSLLASTTSPFSKKTIMIPIEDSNDVPIRGLGYDWDKYAKKEKIKSSYGDYVEDSTNTALDGYVMEEDASQQEFITSSSGDFVEDSSGFPIEAYISSGSTGKVPLEEVILEAEVTPGIRPGDEIVISTIKGKKSATLLRAGKEYNILGAISKSSKWIQVIRGYNDMGFWAYYGEDFVNIEYIYEPLYAGV